MAAQSAVLSRQKSGGSNENHDTKNPWLGQPCPGRYLSLGSP